MWYLLMILISYNDLGEYTYRADTVYPSLAECEQRAADLLPEDALCVPVIVTVPEMGPTS